jgi:hypothetical protein
MVSTEKRTRMLSVRVTDEEYARVKRVCAEIKIAHRYLTDADIFRELLGLIDTGLIRPAMRRRLQAETEIDEVDITGDAPTAPSNIKPVIDTTLPENKNFVPSRRTRRRNG